ncbi:hypothetical protein D3C80_1024030 [compost metagenome]
MAWCSVSAAVQLSAVSKWPRMPADSGLWRSSNRFSTISANSVLPVLSAMIRWKARSCSIGFRVLAISSAIASSVARSVTSVFSDIVAAAWTMMALSMTARACISSDGLSPRDRPFPAGFEVLST